jgi:hypothetical protein
MSRTASTGRPAVTEKETEHRNEASVVKYQRRQYSFRYNQSVYSIEIHYSTAISFFLNPAAPFVKPEETGFGFGSAAGLKDGRYNQERNNIFVINDVVFRQGLSRIPARRTGIQP